MFMETQNYKYLTQIEIMSHPQRQCLVYFILSIIVILITIFCTLAEAELTTAERIKKHEEWLKQRSRQKSLLWMGNRNIRLTTEMPKLWNFKDTFRSTNDVYPPDNETISIIKTTTTSITTTPTAITDAPKAELFTINVTNTYNINETMREELPSTTSLTVTPPATRSATMYTTTAPLSISKQVTQRLRVYTNYPKWGNWHQWSDCSRRCSGGLMLQQRKCINHKNANGKRFVSKDCVGVYRRYQLCNQMPCPATDEDFRAEQCSAFNDVSFQGQKYTWEPYIKGGAECELNCKPIGMKYFATLNNTVIDGTPCYRPAEYYRYNYHGVAMCVSGICKAITNGNGIVASFSANSGSVGCGGLICRPVTGIFTRDPLPEEAYIHVATIPAGSSNISITELKNSINLLVLRTSEQNYIFNGDSVASVSGAYEAAGTTFDYHRIDGIEQGDGVTEWITCTGPVREDLELMIFSKSINPGIKYEYLLPITSESEENDLSLESDGFLKAGDENISLSSSRSSSRKRRYAWKVVGFSPCTKSCGGGTQQPIIHCVRENPLRYFPQRRCMHAEKPVLNENLLRCNTQPCPAYWRIDEWTDCLCHQGVGQRQREINCVQELATGIVIHVDKSACLEEQPNTRKSCECAKHRRRLHARYRLGNSTTTSGQTHYRKREKAGIWLMSDWNQFCGTDCGHGIEYRTIFCERTKQNPERCDQHVTPELTRPCEREQSCNYGEWFTGPWSPCNGNCFNLTRTRQVLCIQNQLIVEAEDCKPEGRPQEVEKCSHEEVAYCGPRWHYSDWSECSKTCDGGTQKRTVKCLTYDEKDNVLRESTLCRYSLRESIYRSCNTQKCEAEPLLELLQNDVAAVSCVDEFSNCQWVTKAKLCSYEYYKKNCCYSCGAN